MATTVTIDSNIVGMGEQLTIQEPKTVNKTLRIALSAIFTVGLIFAYALGAPWMALVGLFVLALVPLFPLGKVIEDLKDRIFS